MNENASHLRIIGSKMGYFSNIWRKLTPTEALQSSGAFEMAFFESIYRVAYIAGLSTSDRGVSYLLYSTTVKLLIAMVVCGEVWYAYSEALSLDEIAACINVIVIQLITTCKIKNMLDHKDVYKRLATSMESPLFDTSTVTRKKLVEFWAKRHEGFLKLLLGLGNCTLAAWHLYPLVDELEYNLMVGVRLPFHYNTPIRYPFTYIVVGIAFTYTSHFVMVTDLIMQAHLLPLICQMAILADCFENILKDCGVDFEGMDLDKLILNKEFTERYLMRLSDLVEQHKRILNYAMDLKVILSIPMLCQLAASGTLICFIGYQATATLVDNVTKCLMSLFYLGYNMFGFYIICRWCEEITIQSQNIGDAAYCSGWERGVAMVRSVRSTIMLVIVRANKPLIFTAGGMYNLSLTSYTTLVKTSYSALTVLLRFRHE